MRHFIQTSAAVRLYSKDKTKKQIRIVVRHFLDNKFSWDKVMKIDTASALLDKMIEVSKAYGMNIRIKNTDPIEPRKKNNPDYRGRSKHHRGKL